MSSNPNASTDTLSETQQQLLANAQQLQDAQKTLMDRYAATTDPNERKKLANEMDKIVMLSSNLMSSTGKIALVQNQAVTDGRNSAKDLTYVTQVMDAQLKDARNQLDAINTSRSEKERMIELNTYYGKRFMAQAGVMKIFIYMCIPVLILAVLANAGFLPNYIAGFMIITTIVIGIVYIYGAVHDINRRDAMNFDEYTWEFDPSRVGSVINPDHGGKHKKKHSNADTTGCSNGQCCASPTTWDATANKCTFVNNAQGDGSAVKGTSSHKVGKHGAASIATTAASTTTLLGDLSSTATTVTPTATTGPPSTTGPTATTGPPALTSNLCWSTANRALTGRCLGDWTYDSAADTCTPPAGSAVSNIPECVYKVGRMNTLDHNAFANFYTTCQLKDSPNCTTEPTFTSCWTNANRAKQGECMGGWTYDFATDSCYADAGSTASQTPGCGSYKVSDMIAKSQDEWASFVETCKVGGQYDLPNCV